MTVEKGALLGHYEIVSALGKGATLGQLLRRGALALAAAANIAIQFTSALVEAHQAGIVHRDLKPDNVICARRDSQALDFGIARLARPDHAEDGAATMMEARTHAGMLIGTPQFMSPEQARGPIVDHQTDTFSFGVVFYENAFGTSPFAAATVSDALAVVLTRPVNLDDRAAEAGRDCRHGAARGQGRALSEGSQGNTTEQIP